MSNTDKNEDNRDVFEKVLDSSTYQNVVRPMIYGAAGGYAFVGAGRKIDKLLRKKKNPLPRYERQVRKAKIMGAGLGSGIGLGAQSIYNDLNSAQPTRRK